MARLKRKSAILDSSLQQMAGMQSIDDTLDFGDGYSLANLTARITTFQTTLNQYNTQISSLDESTAHLNQLEADLNRYANQLRSLIGIRYGTTSVQYMQAGGKIRKRASKRPTVAERPTATAQPQDSLPQSKTTPPEPAPPKNGKGTPAAAMN
jgi:hypothetical protein